MNPVKENNKVQVILGGGEGNTLPKLYDPLAPWFEKTRLPGGIGLQP